MMGKLEKKLVRDRFRAAVFARAGNRCECCNIAGRDRQGQGGKEDVELDAHHITNRNEMPGGGYVKENGISVCAECHLKAEEHWSSGTATEGFAPADLYTLISSSVEQAMIASKRSSA